MVDEGPRINCQPTGNPRCNPETWNSYGGYSNGCCSPEEKCFIDEGDCNFHEDCAGSLVCTPDSCPLSKDPAKSFHKRAACCQQPSGEYIYGINLIIIVQLYHSYLITIRNLAKDYLYQSIFQNTILKTVPTLTVILMVVSSVHSKMLKKNAKMKNDARG